LNHFDVIIIGAGAAGLMCAIESGKRKKKTLVLDKANKAGKKILMSGGGRCNFTNYAIAPEKYISHNPHFCKSALKRFTQWDFIHLVEKHGIPYFEKTLGQLFCENKAHDILTMLLDECKANSVLIQLKQSIKNITQKENLFNIQTETSNFTCDSLVIACGGLSIPSMGSSALGYHIAKQFGLNVYPTRAGLVPFTLHDKDKLQFSDLSGVSVACEVRTNGQRFNEMLLFTHRGLSGPSMLQISSYWQPGEPLNIELIPALNLLETLTQNKKNTPNVQLMTALKPHYAKSLLFSFIDEKHLNSPLKHLELNTLSHIVNKLKKWEVKPNNTEGYRTAEVTLGGVDCNELSSKTFEAKKVPGLYFIGEVLDVTGWLGGYNFQWAWSSGWAAGQAV